jgi:hypothetical protein
LDGIAARTTAYRFDLLDNAELLIGELHPARDDLTPVLTHDTTRTIVRDIASFTLTPADAAAVNPLSDRVRPWLILSNGAEFPLGVYLFADASTPQHSYGETIVASLVDKGLILDQAIAATVGVSAGADVRSLAVSLLDEVGLVSVVESAARPVEGPMAWPGGTTRWQVLADLGYNVGWSPPWFDHDGVCRVQQTVDPLNADVEVAYTDTVYADTAVGTNDLLHAVNRTIAISSDSVAQAYVGIYDVPSSEPHSFYSRGFYVVEVFNVQGIGSQAAINRAARTLALTTGAHRPRRPSVEHMTFSGAPDPRHNGYTVVEAFGLRWVEESWTLTMAPVGPMTHVLRSGASTPVASQIPIPVP